MRFIRVHGRVVPVNDGGGAAKQQAAQHRQKALKGNAVVGAAGAATLIGLREAAHQALRPTAIRSAAKMKLGFAVAGASYAGAIGASVYSGLHSQKADKIDKQTVGQSFKTGLKNLGATVAGAAAVVGLAHGAAKAGLAARPAIKKAAGAAREGIKFRKAKKVASVVRNPVRGLLK